MLYQKPYQNTDKEKNPYFNVVAGVRIGESDRIFTKGDEIVYTQKED